MGSCQRSKDRSSNSTLLQFGITDTWALLKLQHSHALDQGRYSPPNTDTIFGCTVWLLRRFFCSFRLAPVCTGVVERRRVMSWWLEAERGRKIATGLSSVKELLVLGAQILRDTSKDIKRDCKIFHKPCYCGKKFICLNF